MFSAIIGLLGVVIGGLITYLSGIHFININRKIDAGRALRKELLILSTKIDPKGHTSHRSVDEEVINNYDNHNFLAEEYRYYLSKRDKESFEEAWCNYSNYVDNLRWKGRPHGKSGQMYTFYNKEFHSLVENVVKHT